VATARARPTEPTGWAAETNRRYSDKLKRPVDARTVSTVLRRLCDAGELHQARPGSAAHEAVYSRGGRGRGLTVRVVPGSDSFERHESEISRDALLVRHDPTRSTQNIEHADRARFGSERMRKLAHHSWQQRR
jgi:hypothetical protein